jgi:hypothetical protein
MTLNISLLSRNVMAQSSDLRLTDPRSGALVEDASPKQVDITYFTWRAIIGYTGVAQLGGKNTHKWLVDLCRLTHKSAKGGRYASEEETGEDMSQILVSILFSVLCQKGGTPHPAATTRGTAGRGSVPFTPQRRCARVLPVS